jgi:hypothetical protein
MSGTDPRGRKARREQTVKRVRNPVGGTYWGLESPGQVDLRADVAVGARNPMRAAGAAQDSGGDRWCALEESPSLRESPVLRRRKASSGKPRGRRNGEAGAGNRIAATVLVRAPKGGQLHEGHGEPETASAGQLFSQYPGGVNRLRSIRPRPWRGRDPGAGTKRTWPFAGFSLATWCEEMRLRGKLLSPSGRRRHRFGLSGLVRWASFGRLDRLEPSGFGPSARSAFSLPVG